MSFLNQSDWINIGVAISSLIVSISSLVVSSYLILKHRRELSFSEHIANAPEFLYKEYINRELAKPITIDGQEYNTLREARNAITKRIGKKERQGLTSIKDEAWNEFTYQLSIALQNVGLMILAGAVPIKLVLPNVAGLIVEDWNLCSKIVEARRTVAPMLKTSKKLSAPIYFQRRHAEWLATAAAIYLYNYWEGEGLNEWLHQFQAFEKLEKREQELRGAEPYLVLDKTSKEIDDFLYGSPKTNRVRSKYLQSLKKRCCENRFFI